MFWNRHGIEKKDLLTPVSVLVGSILISASILSGQGSTASSAKSLAAAGAGDAPLGEQAGPVKVPERRGAASIGSGKVEIVEFSDFQCPFCQKFYNGAYKDLKTKYIDTGKVKFTFRHYPLPFHGSAQKAAEAFECAASQGKAFEYHDVLFQKLKPDGTGLAISDLKQYAVDLKLDPAKFNACLDSGEKEAIVKKDMEDAKKIGVDGTPTFYINGEKVVGALPLNSFEAVIERQQK